MLPMRRLGFGPLNNQSEKCPFCRDLALKNCYFARKCIYKSSTMDVLRLSLCLSKILVQFSLIGRFRFPQWWMKVKKKLEKNSFLLAFSIFLIDFFKNMGILANKPLYIPIIYIATKLDPDTRKIALSMILYELNVSCRDIDMQ